MSKKFIPYANESDVLHIGGLTVENRSDRITISGDIDLTLDKAGQANARALHQLLADILAKLDNTNLPDQLPPPSVSSTANPFA